MNKNEIIKEYVPIDYNRWDNSGRGKNIFHLMNPIEREIWNSALRYQDKRDDVGHVENVTYFAIKLLNYLKAGRSVVVPAAILHDIGWSQMTTEELKQFYLPNWKEYEPALRKRHQEEGIRLADKLLSQINYPKEFKEHILEIISQHDTRKGFFYSDIAKEIAKLELDNAIRNYNNRGIVSG